MRIEFSTDHSTGQAIYKIVGEPIYKELTEKDTDMIRMLIDNSKTFYPEQYEALCMEYGRSGLNNPSTIISRPARHPVFNAMRPD